MYKKDKRMLKAIRYCMRSGVSSFKRLLSRDEKSLVSTDAQKIRGRLLGKLYAHRFIYQAKRDLMEWKRKTEEAARNAGLGNNK